MFRRFRWFPLIAFVALCFVVAGCSSATSVGASSKKDTAALNPAVAVIDGQPITQNELDERVSQQIYEIRQQALEQMLAEKLLDKEAKAQGITRDALLAKEVEAKVTEPAQAEIDQVWEANKARLPGKTKEQMQPEIVKFLKDQKKPPIQQSFLKSLRSKYKVQVLMEPARVNVGVDDDPARGPAAAKVTIVEFSDFQCPFCSRVEGTVKQVMENYKDKVRFVYRDFPLSIHALAPKASEAAQCANEQGKFWEYHDALYADQTKLAVADLQATAERLGLKGDAFKTCLESGKFAAEVSKDMEDGTKAGVNSTPSFFINGIPVVGAQGYEAFSEVIDRELARPGK